jgi:hypothetical protein
MELPEMADASEVNAPALMQAPAELSMVRPNRAVVQLREMLKGRGVAM